MENPPLREPKKKTGYEIKTTACPYCVVGCGYQAHVWREGTGSTAPPEDLKNLWMSPSWSGKVRCDGVERTAAVVPDPKCPVNEGNHSIRGGSVGAALTFQGGKTQDEAATRERLTTPMIRVSKNDWAPMHWDEATDLMADLIKAASKDFAEPRHVGCKLYGYHSLENTYVASSLLYNVIGTGNVAWHDRPSVADSSPGLHDATLKPHTFSYEDLRDCDVVFLLGSNAYECQSVLFQQSIAGRKLVVLDPRRTITADYAVRTGGIHLQPTRLGVDCLVLNALARLVLEKYGDEEIEALRALVSDDLVWAAQSELRSKSDRPGQERILRQIRRIRSFADYEAHLRAAQEFDPARVAEDSGIPLEQLQEAAALLVRSDLRCAILYEKGLIWGFNYANTAAVANLAVITFNFNAPNRESDSKGTAIERRMKGLRRKRGFCGRLGGHQKGWARPSRETQQDSVTAFRDRYVDPTRPGEEFPIPNYQDFHLAGHAAYQPDLGGPHIEFGYPEGRRPSPGEPVPAHPEDIRLFWVIGCNPAGDVPNAQKKWERIRERLNVENNRPANKEDAKRELLLRVRAGGGDTVPGLVVVHQDIYPNYTSEFADILLPAAAHGEQDFTRSNGEGRMRLYERFQDPPLHIKNGASENRCIADWEIFHRIAKAIGERLPDNKAGDVRRERLTEFKWKSAAEIFEHLAEKKVGRADKVKKVADESGHATAHDFLRERGTSGHQFPPSFHTGQLGPFFVDCRWDGVAKHFAKLTPERGEIWLTNGRFNEAWNSMYSNIRNAYLMGRYPDDLPGTILEVNPAWAGRRRLKDGDVVEVSQDDKMFKAVLALQDSVPDGGGFALFSYPCSSKVPALELGRVFTGDGYVNNVADVYVDPTGPIAANKYARAKVRKLKAAKGVVTHRNLPTTAQRSVAFHETFAFPGRAQWMAREVLVSRGLPRVSILVRSDSGKVLTPGATHEAFWRTTHGTRSGFLDIPLMGQAPLIDDSFDPDRSLLVQVLEGSSKLPRMPMRSAPLEQKWINRIRSWIERKCPGSEFAEIQAILDYSVRIHGRHFGSDSIPAERLMLDPDFGAEQLKRRARLFVDYIRVPEDGPSRMSWRDQHGRLLTQWTKRDVEILERHLRVGTFETVQAILSDAVKGLSTTALHGDFWNKLDRDAFVKHKVMFAGGAVPIIRLGDGANSPLVQAIRGIGPFKDFRMPFARDRIPEHDIRIIERWIDDGCP